jgi:hypothetical protein
VLHLTSHPFRPHRRLEGVANRSSLTA